MTPPFDEAETDDQASAGQPWQEKPVVFPPQSRGRAGEMGGGLELLGLLKQKSFHEQKAEPVQGRENHGLQSLEPLNSGFHSSF